MRSWVKNSSRSWRNSLNSLKLSLSTKRFWSPSPIWLRARSRNKNLPKKEQNITMRITKMIESKGLWKEHNSNIKCRKKSKKLKRKQKLKHMKLEWTSLKNIKMWSNKRKRKGKTANISLLNLKQVIAYILKTLRMKKQKKLKGLNKICRKLMKLRRGRTRLLLRIRRKQNKKMKRQRN